MPKLIDSDFSLLDVKNGRNALRREFECNDKLCVPVTLRGFLVGVWSKDDGTSIEFEMDVRQAVRLDALKSVNSLLAAEMEYDREQSMALRENVIQLRDSALTSGHMEWAVHLSHMIAWMAVVIDERWPQKPEKKAAPSE